VKNDKKDLKRRIKLAEKLKDSNKELLNQIESLKSELEDVRKSHQHSKKIQMKLTQEKEDLSRSFSLKEEELNISKMMQFSSNNNLNSPDSRKNDYAALMAEYQHFRRNVEETMELKDEEFEKLCIELEMLKKENLETKDMLESAQSTIAKLRMKLEEHQLESSTTSGNMNSSFLLELEKEIEQKLTPKIQPHQDFHSKLQSRKSQYNLNFTPLKKMEETEMDKLTSANKHLESEKKALQQKLHEEDLQKQKLQSEVDNLQKVIDKLQKDNRSLAKENEELSSKIQNDKLVIEIQKDSPKISRKYAVNSEERLPLVEKKEGKKPEEDSCCCFDCCTII
jgi:chromosome segregation ATPase